jgi:hypothetical protein
MPVLTYEPLNEARNEIRLLQPIHEREDEQGPCTGADEELITPRFILITVSLDDYTEETKSEMKAKDTHMIPNRDHKLWEDACQEKASRPSLSDQLEDAEIDQMYHARWVWGDYFALSYVWGEIRHNKHVKVNGVIQPVTDNLFRILQQLWSGHTPGLPIRYARRACVWVDAISINQLDLEERSRQVRRMGTIYRSAFGTYAFLQTGLEDSDLDRGLDMLEDVARGARVTKSPKVSPAVLQQWEPSTIVSLGHVLLSTYWTRLWILQEIVISTRLIFIGQNHAILPKDLKEGLVGLITSIDLFRPIFASDYSKIDLDEYMTSWSAAISRTLSLYLMRIRRSIPGWNSGRYLEHHQLMEYIGDTQQHDFRDKIYGLLSLFDDGLRSAISPDYRLSVAEIYTDFARLTIYHFKSLDYICLAQPEARDTHLPSWVPDWTKKPAAQVDLISMNESSPYRTTSDSKIQVQFHEAGMLSAMGAHIR